MLATPTFEFFPLSYHRRAGMLLLCPTSTGALGSLGQTDQEKRRSSLPN